VPRAVVLSAAARSTLSAAARSTLTESARQFAPVPLEKIEQSLTLIGRRLEPDEVSLLAVYLAGDEGRMVTGQAWNVCGGMLMV